MLSPQLISRREQAEYYAENAVAEYHHAVMSLRASVWARGKRYASAYLYYACAERHTCRITRRSLQPKKRLMRCSCSRRRRITAPLGNIQRLGARLAVYRAPSRTYRSRGHTTKPDEGSSAVSSHIALLFRAIADDI